MMSIAMLIIRKNVKTVIRKTTLMFVLFVHVLMDIWMRCIGKGKFMVETAIVAVPAITTGKCMEIY